MSAEPADVLSRVSVPHISPPPDAPKRRFMDCPDSPTFVGHGTLFAGDMIGDGQFVIFGHVRGDGDLGGNLHIAAGASWQGHIRAENAIIAGRIEGSILVRGKIEIGSQAVIHGGVTARSVSIASGAVVDGEVKMASSKAIHKFEEKRRP